VTFELACTALMDHAERLMRQAIAKLPDGVYRAETAIDGYLDSDDPTKKELPIVVTITKKDDSLVVDLTGTAPQVPDRPINMPLEGTADIAIWLTIRSVLLDTEIHGHIPVNAGLIRPITIVAPKGCLANPTFPAPTIARFCPGNQLADTVMKALSAAMPGNVSAGIGNLKVIAFSGLKDETHWVHMEIFEGSYGGRLGKDGMDAVDTLYANTRNNPIEDIESHVPLRVTRYELRENAVAPGRWRGGLNSIKEVAFLSDGNISVEGDGHSHTPWGFQGGGDGRTSQLQLIREGQPAVELPSMLPTVSIAKGDRIRAIGGIGGGYGKALERPAAAVVDDVLDGYLTRDAAARDFRVVIGTDGKLDATATTKLRAAG
jgi:N-methylhydantoinase B